MRLAPLDQYLAFELGVHLRRPERLSDLARGAMDRILNESGAFNYPLKAGRNEHFPGDRAMLTGIIW